MLAPSSFYEIIGPDPLDIYIYIYINNTKHKIMGKYTSIDQAWPSKVACPMPLGSLPCWWFLRAEWMTIANMMDSNGLPPNRLLRLQSEVGNALATNTCSRRRPEVCLINVSKRVVEQKSETSWSGWKIANHNRSIQIITNPYKSLQIHMTDIAWYPLISHRHKAKQRK